MSNYIDWSIVENDERYINADDNKKEKIKNRWFADNIETDPRYSPEKKDKIWGNIFGEQPKIEKQAVQIEPQKEELSWADEHIPLLKAYTNIIGKSIHQAPIALAQGFVTQLQKDFTPKETNKKYYDVETGKEIIDIDRPVKEQGILEDRKSVV